MKRCHWDTDLGWLTPEHRADCNQHDCEGCRPCPKTHCAMRGRCPNHVNAEAGLITCPGCIGKVRGDLRAIEHLSDHLMLEAIERGVDSEPAVLAGPAADPEASMWRRITQTPKLHTLDPADDQHPLTVLGTWDFMLREDYDQPTALTVTVARSAAYIGGLLDRVAQDDEQDFELLAAELRACRSHLEDVMGDSRTPERGAPCPACRVEDKHAPRLVKHWERRTEEYAEGNEDRAWTGDRWECPRCKQHWSEADYRIKVGDDYIDNAETLTIDHMSRRTGVVASTLRRWASRQWNAGSGDYDPPRLPPAGKSHDGRKTYRVADAEGLRDGTRGASLDIETIDVSKCG